MGQREPGPYEHLLHPLYRSPEYESDDHSEVRLLRNTRSLSAPRHKFAEVLEAVCAKRGELLVFNLDASYELFKALSV